MYRDICELCGCNIEPDSVLVHSIVPREVTEQCGMSDSGTVKLCTNCYNEVKVWYLKRVSSTTYDWGMQHFRPKSPDEMVKEYQAAYTAFVRYRKRLLHMS